MVLPRIIKPEFIRLSTQYPVVTITGPRQSGKTTLCKDAFGDWKYFSMENPEIRKRAMDDPNRFLEDSLPCAILDEIQRAPELLSYIQGLVDAGNRPGMFILTGSAQFELLANISQSLAGRTAILRLLPFSTAEAYAELAKEELNEILFTGFYPRIFDQHLEPMEAMAYYCSTYLERDVRSIVNVRDMNRFQTFLKLCAGRTAQILNLNTLGNDCGVNHNTAANWFSVLEASYIVHPLRPHYRNFNKRLIKSPKMHFLDTGLASYLIEMEQASQMATHPLRGSLFESFVISELLKQRLNCNKQPNLFYWRDNVGHELDVLLDFGNVVLPVEIKSGKTVVSDFFKNIEFYRKINPSCNKAAVIYGGDSSFVQNNTWVVSYKDIGIFSGLDHELDLALPAA